MPPTWEPVELQLMWGSAATLIVIGILLLLVLKFRLRRGASSVSCTWVHIAATLLSSVVVFKIAMRIIAVINDSRYTSPIFSGESKIVGSALWFLSLFAIMLITTLAGALMIGRRDGGATTRSRSPPPPPPPPPPA